MYLRKFALAAICAATALAAAPKAVKPRNFADIFGKNWALEKATVKGKDMTAQANANMTGGVLIFTFAEDGKMTTTDPSVVAIDWVFNQKGLNIHTEQAPTPETPAGAKGPQATIFYQIKKLTKDTLVLDLPMIKMVLTFKSK